MLVGVQPARVPHSHQRVREVALQELIMPRAQEVRPVERNFRPVVVPGNFGVGVNGVGVGWRGGLGILRRYFFACSKCVYT